KLTIIPPDPTFGPYVVVIQTVSAPGDDWDLEVYDPNGKLIGSSGNGASAPSGEVETVTLTNPPAGTYTVSAAPFAVAQPYQGSASLQHLTATALGGNGTEPLSYAVYPNPNGVSGGEPSCGVDWKTKKVMYQAGLTTLRVSFNDCTSPATAKWEDVSFITTSVVSLDAILFTDRFTNRTFVSQLTGQDSLAAFPPGHNQTAAACTATSKFRQRTAPSMSPIKAATACRLWPSPKTTASPGRCGACPALAPASGTPRSASPRTAPYISAATTAIACR